MPLDKAIESGKEKRRQYYRSKRFDRSCRNHGSCGYCRNNRLHKTKRNQPILFDDEYQLGDNSD